MLRRDGQRGQTLLIVLTFISTFALILWAAAFFVSGSFKAQGAVVKDTKATYAVDAALQWGLAYIRINALTCAAGTVSPPLPSPGPTVNGYPATVTISPDATCTVGVPVFNLTAQAGPRSGSAQVTLPPSTPITYLQGAAAGNAGATSVARAFPANVAAGDTIIVAVVLTVGTVTGVTDSRANTYAKAVGNNNNSNGNEVSLWYAANVNGGSVTVTAAFSAVSDDSAIAIHEYGGLASASPLDRTAGAGNDNTAPSSGATASTTQAAELVVGAVGDDPNATTFTAGAGFTLRQRIIDGTVADIATEDKVVSTVGPQTATFTADQVAAWSCVVATFKAAASTRRWTLNWYLLQ
jgi:hypothetical protein